VREVELNPEMQKSNAASGHQEVEEDDLTQLQFLIEAGEWDEAELRMKSHPEEIVGLTSNHCSPFGSGRGRNPFSAY
jgi:hypothetical protein